MLLRAIDRKLLRELARLKGQIAAIALVLASGIASFIMLRGTADCLQASQDAYYDRYRFAHVFVTLERAPEALARRIEALPGVAVVQTRISESVLLPIEGMLKPAFGQLLSLPANRPATNALYLERGRFPAPGRDDEVVLLESFAEAHHLGPGHHVPAVINRRLRTLRVVGIARSPEYVYALRPGALVADPKRCAVLWMDRAALGKTFKLEGSFNEVSLRLQPGASEPAVRAALDRLLVPYGGDGAFGRNEQPSHKILTGELGQLAGLASLVPLVFLGVAVFLIRLVLGRMITLQRSEIAVLKALGYTNGEVGRHYLGLVAVVMLPGSAVGLILGSVLGSVVLDMYGDTLEFPHLEFVLSADVAATALLAGALAAAAGALLAVRAAVQLPPAEAMRPPSPVRYRRGLLERMGFGMLAGPSGMMVLREVQRRPLKTLMSAAGLAGAVSLMILGRFGLDSLDAYLEGNLLREQRHDLAVGFAQPLSPRAVREASNRPGVLAAEALRAVPVRVHYGHRSRDSVLMGLPADARLRRLIDRSGPEVELPEDGVIVTKTLAEVLGARIGDRLELEVREGERPRLWPMIRGFVDEASGMQVYARADTVATLVGDAGAVSAVLLRVDPRREQAVAEAFKRSPRVLDISELAEDVARQRELHESVMSVWTAICSLLAGAVIFGVVYNNARITLAARSRDLASLRVLGFARREISFVLLAGLAIEIALAIPAGLVIGRIWAEQVMANIDQEQFRLASAVSAKTYLLAAGFTVAAAALSMAWVRRGLDRLDLIGVLKTRE